MPGLRPKIKRPEYLAPERMQEIYALYREGTLPEFMAGWMLTTSLKHELRAIYGSDFRAACSLLYDSVAMFLFYHITCPITNMLCSLRKHPCGSDDIACWCGEKLNTEAMAATDVIDIPEDYRVN
jgi:hypothetical protein